ncbi:MAG TPA: M12 family metallo-peptidase [Thermoanaerobaculia bacterium]|nr:M12 family metallo-peptidase [Thermoanaerobaculia bacterium]
MLPTYRGGFGVSGTLVGSFDIQHPGIVWDLYVVTHEIGHNFNTHHTHCYVNSPDTSFPDPVDKCNGAEVAPGYECWSGATSVPAGGGSIMSYCHLQPGGVGNVNLSFGKAGLYGVHSERVPERMRAFVESRAACLAYRPTSPADFNGDGRSDSVLYSNGTWWPFDFFFP